MGGRKKPDSALGLDPLSPPPHLNFEKGFFSYIQVNMVTMKCPLYWLSQPIALKYYCPKEICSSLGSDDGTILLQ
jgi:hypothetical protein